MHPGRTDNVDPGPATTTAPGRPEPGRRRLRLAVAAGVTVALGLGATAVGADLAGGVLYAVLIALLIAVLMPRLRPASVGGLAAVVCFAVELAQLSGAPAAAVESVPALRYVLGTTFDVMDLVAYLIGAALGAVVVRWIDRRAA